MEEREIIRLGVFCAIPEETANMFKKAVEEFVVGTVGEEGVTIAVREVREDSAILDLTIQEEPDGGSSEHEMVFTLEAATREGTAGKYWDYAMIFYADLFDEETIELIAQKADTVWTFSKKGNNDEDSNLEC